jgi:hypothetical protein
MYWGVAYQAKKNGGLRALSSNGTGHSCSIATHIIGIKNTYKLFTDFCIFFDKDGIPYVQARAGSGTLTT